MAKGSNPGVTKGDAASQMARLIEENRLLSADIQRLRAELEQLHEWRRQVTELLQASSPDQVLHDLRNVLNERALLRALASAESQSTPPAGSGS